MLCEGCVSDSVIGVFDVSRLKLSAAGCSSDSA